MANGKLGKQPAKHDPRTVKLGNFVTVSPPVPPSTNWRSAVTDWGVMKNDAIGDCGPVSVAHEILSWTTNNGKPFKPSDDAVVKCYSDLSGYDPRTGGNDNGVNMLDLVKYARTTGIGGHKIGAFAAIDLGNHDLLKEVIYLLDGCVIGLGLPTAWQNMDDWKAPTDPSQLAGQWKPWSWGGHAVSVEDYDADWLYIVTWGKIKRLSWHAYDMYCDESYALFSQDWFSPQFKAPNGFDWAAIAQIITFMTIPPSPGPSPVNPPIPPVPPQPPSPPGDFMQQIIALFLQFLGTVDQKTIIDFLVTFLKQIPNPPFYLQILIRLLQGMVNATPAQMQAMEAHAKSVGLVP